MEDNERRVIRSCWWLRRNTRRIAARMFAYEDRRGGAAAGGKLPRADRPDRLLNPKLNGTKRETDVLREALCEYLPGTLPTLAEMALVRFTDTATEFVDRIEDIVRMDSLVDSMTAECELLSYMTTRTATPPSAAAHRAKLEGIFERMIGSFFDNVKGFYNAETEGRLPGASVLPRKGAPARRAKAERGGIETVARQIREMHGVLTRDETRRVFCWETGRMKRNPVRQRQIRRVWEWMMDESNRSSKYYGLSYACTQTFIAEEGGYANDRALFKFCHAHSEDFL